jgi:hypothetical protein
MVPHDWKKDSVRRDVMHETFKQLCNGSEIQRNFWMRNARLLEMVQDGSIKGAEVKVQKDGSNWDGVVSSITFTKSTGKIWVTVKGPVTTEQVEIVNLCLRGDDVPSAEMEYAAPRSYDKPTRKPYPQQPMQYQLSDVDVRAWVDILKMDYKDLKHGEECWQLLDAGCFGVRYMFNDRAGLPSRHLQIAAPCCVKSCSEATEANHWVLGLVDPTARPRPSITVYDSMKDSRCDVDLPLANTLMTFLQVPPSYDWEIDVVHGDSIQQEDSVSCGALMVYNIVRLGVCKPEFSCEEFFRLTGFDGKDTSPGNMKKVLISMKRVAWTYLYGPDAGSPFEDDPGEDRDVCVFFFVHPPLTFFCV